MTKNDKLNLPLYTQVSSQCGYPMHANDVNLYCVTSYLLKEYTDDWKEYKENGITKVIRGYVRDSLFYM